MMNYRLHIPLTISATRGFHTNGIGELTLYGFKARLSEDHPHSYIVIEDIPEGELASILVRIRRALSWAAVRLDCSILTDTGPIQFNENNFFDAQFTTALAEGKRASPMRSTMSHRVDEPATLLFDALKEADGAAKLSSELAAPTVALGCELFATADFETSENSKFLLFATILEVLAAPARRPQPCVDLVQKLIDEAKTGEAGADLEIKTAFQVLRQAAEHLKNDSIRGSVRRIAAKAAQQLGDPDPTSAGRKAALLYDRRSELVHSAKPVSADEVSAIRRIAREVLAVEAECFDGFRKEETS